ncbi:MAG: SDR family NAD(P)-dependent oxidoreductase [Limnochordia bacterium]|jgi:meso-butanediol dehydrogenase/(S,S)-butanediol dehydrogenase/diacetyl reductase
MRLQDRVVLITGAGRGIGFTIAQHMAREGARLALCDLDGPTVEKAAQELASTGVETLAYTVDVTDTPAVEAMVEDIVEKWGAIDVLVNNAGIILIKPILEITDEEWDKVFQVNVRAAFACARTVGRQMVKQGRGVIINASSNSGKTPGRFQAAYAASKFAVVGLTQALAMELGPHQIRVNAYCPGIVETDMWDYIDQKMADITGEPVGQARRDAVKQIPLGRPANEDDVAKVVVFLASDDSGYINGQSINICGGRRMH